MPQAQIITDLTSKLATSPNLIGLFLAGSFGTGTSDAFSDIDFVAVVPDEQHAAFTETWHKTLEAITPVVFWQQRGADSILVNAVTRDWQRVDLFTTSAETFKSRNQESVKPLIDPDGLFDKLPAKAPAQTANKAKIAATINEFIRVLGLTRVVVGRGEYVTGVFGVGLQRDHLTTLLIEQDAPGYSGGALHLSKVISPASMNILTTLPYPGPDRREVIEAHLAVARAFFPLAKALAARLETDWPDAFEKATLEMLRKELGTEFDVGW